VDVSDLSAAPRDLRWTWLLQPIGDVTLPDIAAAGAADAVHVWTAQLEACPLRSADVLPLLDAAERARADRFADAGLRRRYVLAHAMLRAVLALYLGDTPQSLVYGAGQFGKPLLQRPTGGLDLRFNLAHSGELVALAVTLERELGIDVEVLRRDIDVDAIGQRYFALAERQALLALAPDQRWRAFFSCWTRKEAYIKACGVGLSLALDSFEVSIDPAAQICALESAANPKEAAAWSLRSIEVGPDYAGALAVATRERPFAVSFLRIAG
jgi:4'-phosphopantetheinyl transferase